MDKKDRERLNHLVNFELPKLQLDTTRQLTESINRVIESSTPDIQRTSKLITECLAPTIDGLSTPAFSNLAKTITDTLLPQIDTTLFSDIAKTRTDLLQSVVKPFNDAWAEQFSELTKNIGRLVERSYPPNWRGNTTPLLPSDLETLLLDEGLPLAWVPPRSVLDKMFLAKSRGDRRKVLYNNCNTILKSCLVELESLEKQDLQEYKTFALEAIASIQTGKWAASQALSTNIIDTATRRLFDESSRVEITSRSGGRRIDWKTYPLRRALVFGGIWGSFASYRPGDANIPRQYTRHASTHAVSNRQYTKINSLIAVMHLVAFLKLIDEEF